MPRAPQQPLAMIERLRALRVRAPKDLSIAGEVTGLLREAKRAERVASKAELAWAAALAIARPPLPPGMAQRTTAQRVTRGVLHVRVADASTRFALERWLSAGGLAELRRREPAIKTVKIALG